MSAARRVDFEAGWILGDTSGTVHWWRCSLCQRVGRDNPSRDRVALLLARHLQQVHGLPRLVPER